MSFSGQVKEELSAVTPAARHCQIAELAAILQFCGKLYPVQNENGKVQIQLCIHTENKLVARKCFTLLIKAFNIYACATVRQNKKQLSYILTIKEEQHVYHIFQALKWNEDFDVRSLLIPKVNSMLLKSNCCKRSFIRGAYLTIGSMSDPEKSYHLEFV